MLSLHRLVRSLRIQAAKNSDHLNLPEGEKEPVTSEPVSSGVGSVETTIDLQQQVARLQALLEVSRQVHATTSESEVLRVVLRIVVLELEMSGAAFLAPEIDSHLPLATFGDVPSTLADPTTSTIPDGCAFPLCDHDDHPLATLVVFPPQQHTLTFYELDFLQGLTLQAAVALESARNFERNLQWARVQDLDAARDIQRALVPRDLPDLPGFSLAVRSETCYEVGGDYVDVLAHPGGEILLAVADVAGKGLASALMASSFRSAFRAMASSGIPLDALARQANQHHWQEGEEARRRYVTAILARLDPVGEQIELLNAGHNPGFILTPDGATHKIDASGTPLGMLPGMSYSSQTLPFPPGSRLLLYTDGLTEVFRGEEEFGEERLLHEFSSCQTHNSSDMLDTLWASLLRFAAGSPQADDMTALAIIHLPQP
jgi:serine phosphatase RsbU (regulator of sigma subunit)